MQKAYDTVWRDGLWLKLGDMGVKGKIRSAVLLDGEKSTTFSVEQGVAQGCSLSPILFSVFINDLLKEVEEVSVGVQLCNDRSMTGMFFADDFVGVSDSRDNLQKLLMWCIIIAIGGDLIKG